MISKAVQSLIVRLAPWQNVRFSVVVPCDPEWRSRPLLTGELAKNGLTLESIEPKVRIDILNRCGYPVPPEAMDDPCVKYLRISYPENAFIFESLRHATYGSGRATH